MEEDGHRDGNGTVHSCLPQRRAGGGGDMNLMWVESWIMGMMEVCQKGCGPARARRTVWAGGGVEATNVKVRCARMGIGFRKVEWTGICGAWRPDFRFFRNCRCDAINAKASGEF